MRQTEVAAADIVSEIESREPSAEYYHEIAAIIDAGGADSIYLHYEIWDDTQYCLKKGRFWSAAKTSTALCGRQSIIELKYCSSKKFMIFLKKKPEHQNDAQAFLSASKDAFYRIKSAYSNETPTLDCC